MKLVPFTAVIIDDQIVSRVLLNHIIQGMSDSAKIVEFGDPFKAIEWIAEQSTSIDIILTDYMMPGMNGIDLVVKIREIDCLKNIPIVMITSASDVNVKYAALDAGVSDFLIKPIDVHELQVRCKNLLNYRQSCLACLTAKDSSSSCGNNAELNYVN